MSSFIDILGDDIENIKYVYDFLDKEDLEYLIEVAKKAESRFSGSQLHVAANNHLDDASLSDFRKFGEKLNNVSKENMTALYETNLFRIRTEPSFNFGTLKDVDGNLFEAYEI
jgi:hypothetical protein